MKQVPKEFLFGYVRYCAQQTNRNDNTDHGGGLEQMLFFERQPVMVWYAIKAEPKPPEGAIVPAELRPGPLPHQTSSRLRRRRGGRPHGRPTRRPFGPPRTASARAGRRR